MQDWLVPYSSSIYVLGMAGALMLIQFVVMDVASMKAHHRPGAPVEVDHGNFFFRATRAHANTNESIGAYIVLTLFGLLSGANPDWLNGLSWVYMGGRICHMLCYYANLQLMRSVSFGVSMVALLGMLILGLVSKA